MRNRELNSTQRRRDAEKKRVCLALRLCVSASCLAFCLAASAAQEHWIATWGASPAPQSDAAAMQKAGLEFENQTIREIVHTSVGSDTVRVRLSNAYGKQTLEIAGAHIAVRAEGSAIAPGSDRALTFNGRQTADIPADALVLSDPVKLDVQAGGDLAISIFVRGAAAGAGIHYGALQTSYVAAGDVTGAASLTDARTIPSWVFLTGVEVLAPESAATLVGFGDSITDGAHSTVDANRRWPDYLAVRLRSRRGGEIGVLDAGIGGNRLLHDPQPPGVRSGVSALARFDRDVLAQPGVRYVIVLEGINDLGHAGSSAPSSEAETADDLIAAMKQLIARAHDKGIKIFGATLTPFAGTRSPGYYTPEKDAERKKLNEWIRTSHAFDGVVDFEKAVRDPAHPDQMLPAYDSGDHLHPGDAGYKAMADAIDLAMIR